MLRRGDDVLREPVPKEAPSDLLPGAAKAIASATVVPLAASRINRCGDEQGRTLVREAASGRKHRGSATFLATPADHPVFLTEPPELPTVPTLAARRVLPAVAH